MSNSNSLLLVKFLPTTITFLALCAGLWAIRFAINEQWMYATIFIIVASFLDGIDGRIARFTNSSSEFGAQLDSLSDFVNFGVAPSFIIYIWVGQNEYLEGLSWASVLFFTICMSVRLARFNVNTGKEKHDYCKYFFYGVPAPCGASLAMLPMILSYHFGNDHFFTNPKVVIVYMFILSILIASTIPTISIKTIPINNDYTYIILIFCAFFIVNMIIFPWITFLILGITYILSIPISTIVFFRFRYEEKQNTNN